MRLPTLAFGGCATRLRFAVNMQRPDRVAPPGVHVVGNFQALAGYAADGDPAALPLTDDNATACTRPQIALPAPGRFQYRFVNGNTWAGAETVPAACGHAMAAATANRTV